MSVAGSVAVEHRGDAAPAPARSDARTMPGAALWDLDGTLVDSAALWTRAYVALAEDLGAPLPAGIWEAIAGRTIDESVAVLLASIGLGAKRPAVRRAADVLVAHAERSLDAGSMPAWRPGARRALAAVRSAGVPTALVTTTWRSVARRIIAARGMTFDAVVCGDEVANGKPAPDAYLDAASRLGVAPRECVVVEDSSTGVRSAEAAGMAVLVVPSGAPIDPGPWRHVWRTLDGVDAGVLARLATSHVDLGAATAGREGSSE